MNYKTFIKNSENNFSKNINDHLPTNYTDKIVSNLEHFDNYKAKIGIVIPTYKRKDYLEASLASLKKSKLKNCVICIIDESNASKEPYEGYVLLENCDSPATDACCKTSTEECIEYCNQNKVVAFNNYNWCKSSLRNIRRKEYVNLYVKKEYYDKSMDKYINKTKYDYEIEQLITDFKLSVPIIKIFKKTHANMFDSFKVGFDLLSSFFDCKYLVTLDSDTIHSKYWIKSLYRLHKNIRKNKIKY